MASISSLHLNTARSWRGGERQTLLLLEGLKQRGHHPTLVCPPESPLGQRAQAAGIALQPLSMRNIRDLMRLRRLIGSLQPHIIHYHTAHAHSSGLLARLGMFTTARTIVHRRVGFSIHRSGFPGLTHFKYGRSVDRFVVSSQEIRQVLLKDGISAERIEVVYDGVPPLPDVTTTSTDIRNTIGVPADALLLGSIGSLSKEKGQSYLLDALGLLKDRQQPVHLVLVGAGDEAESLQQLAHQHGIRDRVHLAGFQQPEQISSWLASFDLYLQPSLAEGLCTSILDALQGQLPVIASAVGGIPEVIEDRVTGLLVAPADAKPLAVAIDTLLDDATLSQDLARAGALRAQQRFSADAMIEGNLTVQRELLNDVTSDGPADPVIEKSAQLWSEEVIG